MKKTTFLLFLFLPALIFSQGLTGEWTDDNGACYKIRQHNNRIFWTMDDSPRVLNVFHGYLAGNIIAGEWADLPGGNMHGDGTLALRVESPDRMVKINQTGNYLGTEWTRGSCSKCDYNLSGDWRGIHEKKNWNDTGYLIVQEGNKLTLSYSGDGTHAVAVCRKNILHLTGWGNGTGVIVNNGKRINFSDGSYWLKL